MTKWTLITGTKTEISFDPVTVEEWKAAGGQSDRPDWEAITLVTASAADEYATRNGARLPTDEELEAAIRLGLIRRIWPALFEWTSTTDGSFRVNRGGCCYDDVAGGLSASFRISYEPGDRNSDLGLRCARDVEEK